MISVPYTFSIPRSREEGESSTFSSLSAAVYSSQLSECHGTTAQKVKREDGGSVYRVTRRVAWWSVQKKRGGRDDRRRPAMTHGAYALLTASDTAMQKQRE